MLRRIAQYIICDKLKGCSAFVFEISGRTFLVFGALVNPDIYMIYRNVDDVLTVGKFW